VLGQFILVARLLLYFSVFIIFVVAMVIINNSVMMATLQRTPEVGTMRAIGAQRGFILGMVLVETLTLGLVFGALGALLGSGVVAALHHFGISAGGNETFYFFFSGPRLFPTLSPMNVIAALIIVILVTILSTLYPAFLATRIAPVRAMQTEE
jgi:ABC-type antimicrobial peptide transport system permease subunit